MIGLRQAVAALLSSGVALASGAAHSQESVTLFAAGSLRAAMTDIAEQFTRASGVRLVPVFGASGLLRDQIASGKEADVFASANMEHPRSLESNGRASAVRRFARNRLCALAAPGIDVTTESLLDRMLDERIRLGTSTPRADPSGDYAFEVFAKAESLRTGAKARLEAKALQLTGGPNSPAPPANRSVYGVLVGEGKADLFLTYCTNAAAARAENAALKVIALPDSLAVGADYGIATIAGSNDAAARFVQFVLGPDGQRILGGHGFSPP
jgi:ABC-type molybdate transport system substrate-binding protein